jgi:hypothetical protein
VVGLRIATPIIRLFRNIPCFRFSYPIHEIIITDNIEQAGYNVIDTKHTILHHGGYSDNIEKVVKKLKRNLEIILENWTELKNTNYKRYMQYIIETSTQIKQLIERK